MKSTALTAQYGETIRPAYGYDAAGRRTSLSTRDGKAACTYDDLDLLTTSSGALEHAADNVSDISYTYDALGRVDVESANNPGMPAYSVDYDFYADGSLQKTTGPNGAISYAYDDAGRLASMNTPAGAFSWDYYDRGLPESLSYPNGVAQSMQFDTAGQVTDIAHARGASAIASFHYHYDANGNRDAITGADGPHAYGYDEINQLTAADHPAAQSAFNPDEFYDYDGAGNRETTHLSAAHVVNELNQLLEDDTYTYAWDLDGNLRTRTEKANPSRVTTYTFNTENRLVRADLPDGTAVSFTYDAAGRRIARTVNGARTSYAHIGHDLAAEYAPSGAPAILYTYGPGIDNVLAATRNGAHYYYHKDALQSVHAITDSTGAITHEYKYDSFGNIVVSDGSTSWNTVTYTGREWDDELRLFHFRSRFYNPKAGYFISEDPILRTNLYIYVNNNTHKYIDPFGLKSNEMHWTLEGAKDTLFELGAMGLNSIDYCFGISGNAQNISQNGDNIGTIVSNIGNTWASAGNCASAGFSGAIYDAQMDYGPGMDSILLGAKNNILERSGYNDFKAAVNSDNWEEAAVNTLYGVSNFASSIAYASAIGRAAKGRFVNSSNRLRYGSAKSNGAKGIYECRTSRRLIHQRVKDPIMRLQIKNVIDEVQTSGRPNPRTAYMKKGNKNIFRNSEGNLPKQPIGYYVESDVWPQPMRGARNSQRLIFGKGGEVYFTSDHYQTFTQLHEFIPMR